MKTLRYLLPVFLTLFMVGCSKDSDIEKEVETKTNTFSIKTSVYTRAVTTSFGKGDVISLFLKTKNTAQSEDFVPAFTGTYNGSEWNLSKTVEFKQGDNAYACAVYPAISNAELSAVPVDIKKQTDMLYSGICQTGYENNSISLTMKHAMAMIAFNITTEGYEGNGLLSDISLEKIPTSATMNAIDGEMKVKENGNYSYGIRKQIKAEGWDSELPTAFVIPFESTGKEGYSMKFIIDGKNYTTEIPAYKFACGIKYIIRLCLTKNGYTVFWDKVTTASLNCDEDHISIGAYTPIGFSFSGTQVKAPVLKGSLYGKIYWGDGTCESYSPSLIHRYDVQGEYDIRVDSWGTTKASFDDIKNIGKLDFSKM